MDLNWILLLPWTPPSGRLLQWTLNNLEPSSLHRSPSLTVARGWILGKSPVLLISLSVPHLTSAYAVQLEMLQQVHETPSDYLRVQQTFPM